MGSPVSQPGDLHAYYRKLGETTRLTANQRGRLELLRTQELLRRFLPGPPAVLLDVGGGTGVHAQWLVADGYQVRLIDPVPEQVAVAATQGLIAEVGDARRLAADDGPVDAVVLLGPLYHLPDAADRARALAEARRVLRPGGVVAASWSSAGTPRCWTWRPTGCWTTRRRPRWSRSTAPAGTTPAWVSPPPTSITPTSWPVRCATPASSTSRCSRIEGPSWPSLVARDDDGRDGSYLAAALTSARAAESIPDLLPASGHLLAVARVP